MALLKPFMLFFDPVRHAKAYYEGLQKIARTEVVTSKSREEFFKDVKDKYNSVSVIYRTSASGAVCRIPNFSPFSASINFLAS
jgi:ABC-type Fe3+-citrate transport system substrate-binding protein